MNRNKKILFSLIPVGTMLFVGECSTRIIGAQDCAPIEPNTGDWKTMIGDQELLWKLEPNVNFKTGNTTTRINAVGLRESLLPSQKKQPNEKRIIVTGDSSIYGWGVRDDQTYAIFLEQELRHRFRQPIEVINLGVPGYSTEQTLRLLDKVGWSYDPDLIIVSNLFSDCNIDAFQDKDALALSDPKPGPTQKVLQNSRLYCAGYMKWVNYQAGLNQSPNRVLMPGIPTGPNAAVTLEKLNPTLALSRVPIDDYLANLDKIRTEAQKRGARMMLAPLAQEWDVGIWNVPMPKPTPDHILPWFPYRAAQKEWVQGKNIPIVSFSEAFKQYKGHPAQLFVDNMHPSAYGTSLMAKTVTEVILKDPALIGLNQRRR